MPCSGPVNHHTVLTTTNHPSLWTWRLRHHTDIVRLFVCLCVTSVSSQCHLTDWSKKEKNQCVWLHWFLVFSLHESLTSFISLVDSSRNCSVLERCFWSVLFLCVCCCFFFFFFFFFFPSIFCDVVLTARLFFNSCSFCCFLLAYICVTDLKLQSLAAQITNPKVCLLSRSLVFSGSLYALA